MTPTDITARKPVYRRADGSIDHRLYYAEAQRRRLRRTPRRLTAADCDSEGRHPPVQDRFHRGPAQSVPPRINAGGEAVGRDPDVNTPTQILKDGGEPAGGDDGAVPVRRRADGSIDYWYYHNMSRRIRAEQHRAAWRWLVTRAKTAVTRCKTGFATTFAFGKGRQAQ